MSLFYTALHDMCLIFIHEEFEILLQYGHRTENIFYIQILFLMLDFPISANINNMFV